MLKSRHLLLIFLPALVLVIFALFIRLIQYEPLYPKAGENKAGQNQASAIIPIYSDDPVIGNKKAPATVIIFSDFGCAHCGAEMALLDELLKKYPDKMKIIWKGLAVTRFPRSTELAHKYGYCANQQEKFKQFADLAFANSDNLTEEILKLITAQLDLNEKKLGECLDSQMPAEYLQKIEQLALGLGIQAVPTIFLNNRQIPAPQILEEWETALKF